MKPLSHCIVLFLALTLLESAPAASLEKKLEVGGHDRVYLVDLPTDYAASKTPLPLVLVFHGGTLGSAAQAERSYGFRELAEQKKFIAVFPDGIDHHWNDGRDGKLASVKAVDDIAFIAALLDRLAADYRIDPRRIYATGISNGAIFSYALTTKLAGRLAAIGAVAGALAEPLAGQFGLSQPVAVIAFNGAADKIVPNGGGVVLGEVGGRVLSIADTVELFAKANGCAAASASETLPLHVPDDGTIVHRATHSGGQANTEVVLYTIEGGGHTWPGAPVSKLYAAIAGPTTQTIDATALMWEFFVQHPRP